jgi:transposase-like protein
MKKYSESDKSDYLRQHATSKVTVSEFCRNNKIGTSTFFKWFKSQKSSEPEVGGTFLPVTAFEVPKEPNVDYGKHAGAKCIRIELLTVLF